MSFYRAPFRDFVREQLEHRVKFLAKGRGNEARPLKWYQQYLTKQAFIRVAPLVKVKSFGDDPPPGFPEGGSTLFMKNFVLEGTPLVWARDREGGGSDGKITKEWFTRVPQFPTGKGLKFGGTNQSLLNNPDLRTNPDLDGFGIIPPPGVTSFSIDTKSFYGNLREAKMSIRCFSIKQFEWIEKIYARPGHHVTIEWGWSHYIDNKTGKIEQQGDLLTDPGNTTFWGEEGSGGAVSAGLIYRELDQRKEERSGNYDGFLGIIKNFQSKMEADGGFTVDVQLIGRGDLLYSMKLDESGDIVEMESSTFLTRADTTVVFSSVNNFRTFSVGDEQKLKAEKHESDFLATTHTNLVNLTQYLMSVPYDNVHLEENDHSTDNLHQIYIDFIRDSPGTNSGFWGPYNPEIKVKNPYDSVSKGALIPPFASKTHVDTFLLNDNTTTNYRVNNIDGELRELGTQFKKDVPTGEIEVGLGGYVRLGYLIKLLNYYCIKRDGSDKPLILIDNSLYTKDFNPNKSFPFNPSTDDTVESIDTDNARYNIYPSCYTKAPFDLDSSLVDDLRNRYHEMVAAEPAHAKVVIKEIIQYYDSLFETKEDEEGTFSNPTLEASKNRNKLDFGVGGATTKEDAENFIPQLLKIMAQYVGSSQPSKILFPHQFKPLRHSIYASPLSKTEASYSTNLDDNFKMVYNLPVLISNNQMDLRFTSMSSLFTKTHTNLSTTRHCIQSNALGNSLSAHAMWDSICTLYSSNKITESYFNLLRGVLLPDIASGKSLSKTSLFFHFRKLEENTVSAFDKDRVIDNVMINTHWLDEYIKKKEEDITLGQLIEEICKQINVASGGSTDLKMIDNPVFGDQVSIVDFNVNSVALKKDQQKQFAFPKTGHTSIYKSISLTGKIPDAMASTIAIGAQGPRNVANIEAVTYKAFLEDVEDRISGGSSTINSSKLNSQIKKGKNKWEKKFVNYFKGLIDMYYFYGCLNIDAGSVHKGWFKALESKAKSAANRMNKDIFYLSQSTYLGEPVSEGAASLPISSIIPLKINIGMEGVSGMLASNIFKLQDGILPPKYNQGRVSYMVSKEKQTIKGGVWETSIEGTMVLDDGDAIAQSDAVALAQAKKQKVGTLSSNKNPIGSAAAYEAYEDEFGFVEIPGTYTDNSKNAIELVGIDGSFVKKDLIVPYLRMKKAAMSQGITMTVSDGFRPPFETIEYKSPNGTKVQSKSQSYFYEGWKAKEKGLKSFTYQGTDTIRNGKVYNTNSFNRAAPPGGSNHGDGIALDLGKIGGGSDGRYKNGAFDEKHPKQLALYEWLVRNSWKFGFVRGVNDEEWHFDYMPEKAILGPYGKLNNGKPQKDKGINTTKFYNKTKQGTFKGLDELKAPEWGSTIILEEEQSPTEITSTEQATPSIYPFPNRAEGNKFREWVNDEKTQEEISAIYTDSKFGRDDKLGRSGSETSNWVERAWEEWGVEYEVVVQREGLFAQLDADIINEGIIKEDEEDIIIG
jgi:hypothetical protein